MKKADTKDLTEGSVWKGVFLFSLPLIASNLLQVLFNMSDVAVVGRFAGSVPLGSVGSTSTLVSLFTSFLIGMSSGVMVIAARYIGRKDQEGTSRVVHTGLLIMLVSGIIILLIGEFAGRWILEILHTKEELIDGADLYLRIYFLGMPAAAVYNFGNAVYSAAGNTRKPLNYLMLAGVLNIILNLYTVIVLHMSVAGVAIASTVSQCVSALCILVSLFKEKNALQLKWPLMKISPYESKILLALSLPSGIQAAIFQIANLFVQIGVNTFSATVVSGNSAATNADGFAYNVMSAFYTACGSYIGQNHGAGKMDRVRKSYQVSLFYSFFFGCLNGLILVLFGKQFLSLFTNEAAVLEAGMYRLRIMGFSYGFSALMDCSIAASRGLGYGNVPTVIVILGSCVFRIAWIYTVFAYFHTMTSLYLLYIFSWAVTGIAEYWYFRKALGHAERHLQKA